MEKLGTALLVDSPSPPTNQVFNSAKNSFMPGDKKANAYGELMR